MLKPQKTGMAVGMLFGAVHVVWSAVVALGWAGSLLMFVTRLHFVESPMNVLPFDFVTAIELIVLASLVGYIIGFVFASIWNKVQK